MKNYTSIIMMLCALNLCAQLPENLLNPTQRVDAFDEYEGSIYSKTKYKESSLINENSGTYNVKLKYNIYADELEYKSETNLFYIQKNPKVHARIDGEYFYFCQFRTIRGLQRNGYYILVEMNDQYNIYKKYVLKIKDPINNELTHTHVPGELRVETKYYLEENGIILELPMSKKEILVSFSDKEEELKSYIKSTKIRFKKEEDLIRLVAKYNALKINDTLQNHRLLSNVIKK